MVYKITALTMLILLYLIYLEPLYQQIYISILFTIFSILLMACFVYNCSACLLNCPLGTNKVAVFFLIELN